MPVSSILQTAWGQNLILVTTVTVEVGEGGEGASSRTIPFHLLFLWLMASAFSLACFLSSWVDVQLNSAQYEPQLNGIAIYDGIRSKLQKCSLQNVSTVLLRL